MQQHKPTTSSTCEATQRALDPEAAREVPGLWRKRDLSETVPFRLRIGLRLHQQGRRVGPCLGHPPTQDTAVPFGAVPHSGLLHTHSRFEAWPHLLGSADTRASCQLQVELLGKEATHLHHHLEPPGVELVVDFSYTPVAADVSAAGSIHSHPKTVSSRHFHPKQLHPKMALSSTNCFIH